MPSLAQVKMRRETESSIAGMSFIRAMVAPIIIRESIPLGRT